ncbi:MAG: hypothetical protein AAFW73_16535 [Bacteroidota bacterium]
MDYKHLSELLEKYWAGESSLAEEAQLREYFQSGAVAPEHEQYAPLFQFFGQRQGAECLSDDFEDQILTRIEERTPATPIRSLHPNRTPLFYLSRIAAAIVLACGLWWFGQGIETQPPVVAQNETLSEREMEEARQAYRQAKEALLLLSTKMNRGTATAARGLSELDKSTQIIK